MMSRPQRIWAINDEAPIARVLRRALAASGYEAPVAGEYEDELEIINSWATGLVVTELSTPTMGDDGDQSFEAVVGDGEIFKPAAMPDEFPTIIRLARMICLSYLPDLLNDLPVLSSQGPVGTGPSFLTTQHHLHTAKTRCYS